MGIVSPMANGSVVFPNYRPDRLKIASKIWYRLNRQERKTMNPDAFPRCPHCSQEMKKWRVPLGSTWPDEFFYVCFNDTCPYFIKGWEQMWENMATRASYRCRLDPDSGKFVPLPVWSTDALKDDIIMD